jgi:hypothetical protein
VLRTSFEPVIALWPRRVDTQQFGILTHRARWVLATCAAFIVFLWLCDT